MQANHRPIFLIICSVVFLFSIRVMAQDGECTNDLEPRLVIGEMGVVLPGSANNVRDTPAASGVLLDAIDGGESFTVLDGPVCNGNFMWWQVETADGIGWTVSGSIADSEYYLMPIQHQLVRYGDIIFDLPPSIATNAEGSLIEAEPSRANPDDISVPQYIEFIFGDYPDEDYREFDYPQIRIYRADAFDDVSSMLGDGVPPAIETLALTLEDIPDLYQTFFAASSSTAVPDDIVGAAQGILAHMAYLDFENGSGIRFVTYYTQGSVVPNNTMLLYRYVGLTADGEYFITAMLPIDAPELMGEPDDNTRDNGFFEYMREVEAFIDNTPSETFTPDLTELDALIASIFVGAE